MAMFGSDWKWDYGDYQDLKKKSTKEIQDLKISNEFLLKEVFRLGEIIKEQALLMSEYMKG